MEKRQSWIEGLKGWGILFIVLGHVAGEACHFSLGYEQIFLRGIYKYVYSFHVPLFFFIAGLTFSGGKRNFREFFLKKCKRLIVPYLCFGLISAFALLVLSKGVTALLSDHATNQGYAMQQFGFWWTPFVGLAHGGGWPDGRGLICNSVLWFLPCLFSLEVICYWVDKKLSGWKCLFIGIVTFILGFILRKYITVALPWGLNRVPYFIPFFLMGRWLGVNALKAVEDRRKFWRWWILLGIFMIGAFAWMTPDPYLSNTNFGWYIVFTTIAFVGVFVWTGCARFLHWGWLIKLGGGSMGIMLMHKFPVVLLVIYVPFIREQFSSSCIAAGFATFFITGTSIILCLLANRLVLVTMPWMLGASTCMKSSNPAS